MRKTILRALVFAATVVAVSVATDLLFSVVFQGGPVQGGVKAFLIFRTALHGATFVLTTIGAALGFAFLHAYAIANTRIVLLGAGLGLFTLAAVLMTMQVVGFLGITVWLIIASGLVAFFGGKALGSRGTQV